MNKVTMHYGASDFSMNIWVVGKLTIIDMAEMSKQGRSDLMCAMLDWRFDGYKGYPVIEREAA